MKTRKPVSPEAMLLRLADLCSRSEQCEHDLRRKMQTAGIAGIEADRIIIDLKERKFLNHERYAKAYANDKVRFAAWGRNKIKMMLAAKHIEPHFITVALETIDPNDYKEALLRTARAKAKSLNLSLSEDHQKLYRHLLSRGFESALVMKLMSAISRKRD